MLIVLAGVLIVALVIQAVATGQVTGVPLIGLGLCVLALLAIKFDRD